MSITHGYTTLGTVRNALGIPSDDQSNDLYLEATIEAVSRMIDNYTGRRFYVNESTEARYYSPVSTGLCWTDDITTVTTLKSDDDRDGVFETTWTTSDYKLLPYNAALNGKPYTSVETSGYGSYEFSTNQRSLQVVGYFGYCTVANQPKIIGEAAKIQSVRLFKRKDAPFGVVGGNEFAQVVGIPDMDPDVKMLLSMYVKRV